MAFVNSIAYYLPERRLTNEELSGNFPEWSVDKISSKTGIYSRPVAAKDEFASDMAIKAAEKLFAEQNISKEAIDFILLCTQSPDYFLPTTACILQDKLGLRKNTGALDFNLGCSGFVYGLALAKGLIDGRMAGNVLLITSETYSKFIHPKDKSNLTIFGDAAAATLISGKGSGGSIGHFDFGTDGSGAGNLMVKQGGLRYPPNGELAERSDDFGNITNDANLYMNGPEIFNFTIAEIPKLIAETLARNGVAQDDIDVFVFHQANRYMLNYLRKKLAVPEEKFYIYLEDCANTVSSTIPIALHQAIKEGKVAPGSKVLVAGFGVGYSWAGTVLQF